MESNANYTIIGLFMIIILGVIIFTILWLSGGGLGYTSYKIYQVYMDESVAGLSKNAPVRYNGVEVGFVEDIELNLKNPQEVILTLKVDSDIPVTKTTQAVLMEQGITGIAYIGLRGGGNHAPPLVATNNQPYPIIKSAPSFLVRLDITLQSLTDNIESLANNVKTLLSKKNIDAVDHTLQHISEVTAAIAKNSDQIDLSLKDFRTVMKNTATASIQFPKLITNIEEGAIAIKAMAAQMSKTTKSIDKTFKQGDIAIDSISNQLVPKTYESLDNIESITDNLRTLSQELSQNPAILLHGKTAPKPGPGE